MKIAIGYLSHVVNKETIFRYNKLVKDLEDNVDYTVYWLIQDNYTDQQLYDFTTKYNINFVKLPSNTELTQKYHKTKYCWEFGVNVNSIDNINTSEEEKFKIYCKYGISFNCILNYIEFKQKYPEYDFYWFMEFDLIFNGDWKLFFNTIDKDNSDFIAEHFDDKITDTNLCAGPHNRYVKYNSNDYPEQHTAMLCICRFSNKLISDLYNYYSTEFGFMETLVPTFVHYNGYSMKDINNIYKFYKYDGINFGSITWSELYIASKYFWNIPFYWDPKRKIKMFEFENCNKILKDNMIYHPLKEDKISHIMFTGAC